MDNRTFTLIKPEAVAAGNTGKILDAILGAGFRLRALKMVSLTRNRAEKFYAVHRERPFYEKLIGYMTSGPVIAAVLEKDNAVADFRRLAGNTDPARAEEGTLRRRFGTDTRHNAVHASDSDEHAREEWEQFFTETEITNTDYSGA